MLGKILVICGTWLFADAWYSLVSYIDKDESFIKCHLIRVIRGVMGLVIIAIGLWGIL